MPGNFVNIDNELPTFTGQESEKAMIEAMVSYITQLVDQLKYTLRNLDTTNFNAKALSDWEAESTEDVVNQVTTLTALVNQMGNQVSGLSTRMGTAEGKIATLQGAVQVDTETGNLTIGGADVEVDVNGTAVNVNGDELDLDTIGQDITGLQDDVQELQGAVQVDQNGDITIGGTGVRVDIDGNVYINGTPQ